MRWRRFSGLVAAAAVAASCSTADPAPSPSAERTVDPAASVATAAVSSTTSASVSETVVDHGDLDPEAVVAAAVLIASGGDVDAAIADGWFSEIDAEAARAGIADGSLAALLD